MRRTLLLCLLLVATPASADEGLWTFDNFPSAEVAKRHGFSPDRAWLDRVRMASIRLSSCSASVVSPNGLVMTNHHCARDCVEDASTPSRDLVAAGFQARGGADEVRCPEEYADQLVAIEDVTARIGKATQGLSGRAFASAKAAEVGRIEKACKGTDPRNHCQVVALYHGGLYHLYRYRRWDDVRLVFAPEEAMAAFGGDPDNYEFPRWAFDVSFLRLYENGQPARTPQYMRWSRRGAQDGQLVFVSGNPGRTSRLLTVAQIEAQRDLIVPETAIRLAEERGFLAEFRRRGPEQARIGLGPLLEVENNLKRAKGQFGMLVDPRFMAARREAEKELRARVAGDPARQRRFGGAWRAIESALAAYRPYRKAFLYLEDGRELARVTEEAPRAFDSKLFRYARALLRGAAERRLPADRRLREFGDAQLAGYERRMASTAPIHAELEIATLGHSLGKMREELGPDHPLVRRLLARETPEEVATRVVRGTKLADPAVRARLWREPAALAAAARTDPMLRLAALVDADARAVRRRFEAGYEAVVGKNAELIARARFEVYGTSVYPDATFTPRLSFGAVRGYEEDGAAVPPLTRVGGLWPRATGTPPFAPPASWLAARRKLPAGLPFNFAATPDTVGGNSGSPGIDRSGEIIGLYFDQNIQGTATPFGYDESMRRGLFVHSELIIKALDAVYGARRLVAELRGR